MLDMRFDSMCVFHHDCLSARGEKQDLGLADETLAVDGVSCADLLSCCVCGNATMDSNVIAQVCRA